MPRRKSIKQDKPLRKNIRLLGNLLGQVIEEQEGRRLFELEEQIRQTSKQLRKRFDPSDQLTLQRLVRAMDPADMANSQIVRRILPVDKYSRTTLPNSTAAKVFAGAPCRRISRLLPAHL